MKIVFPAPKNVRDGVHIIYMFYSYVEIDTKLCTPAFSNTAKATMTQKVALSCLTVCRLKTLRCTTP